ncbi:MAG: DNA gyrase C-terminal beta-propeller domain-containing protein, partial [Persicimonas sp.]
MSRDEIIDHILKLAEEKSPDHLLETSAATLNGELYEAAAETFGGWDAALAEALVAAVDQKASATDTSAGGARVTRSAPDEPHVEREVTEAAKEPLFALTSGGAFYQIDGPQVPVTDEPTAPVTPHGAGHIERLVHLGDVQGVIVFSNRGRYFGLDRRMIPRWEGDLLDRRLQEVLHLEDDERVVDVAPRTDFYGGRLIHVTRGGKGKASDISEMNYTLDYEGRQAFLLDEGDEPVAVLAGPDETSVWCASARGKAIHFPSDELRSMGLKAVGVKLMKLADESDEVVGAFLGDDVEQAAVITERGLAKRVDFGEFRTQGRAGAGLQLARLDHGDRIATVAPCEPGGDLAVATSRGRLHRMPAT